jgi:hypothetical protein
MAITMKESGSKGESRERAYIIRWMDLSAMDSGKMTSSMGKLLSNIWMEPILLGSIMMAKNTEKGNLYGITNLHMKAISMKIKLKDLGHFYGRLARFTVENGRQALCMEGEISYLKTGGGILDSFRMISFQDTVFSFGLMEEGMKVFGKMEFNKEKEFIVNFQERYSKDNGKKENSLSNM